MPKFIFSQKSLNLIKLKKMKTDDLEVKICISSYIVS